MRGHVYLTLEKNPAVRKRPKDFKKELKGIKQDLSSYVTKYGYGEGLIYKVPINSNAYWIFKEFVHKYDKYMKPMINFKVKFSEEEMDKAAAYIPDFRKTVYENGDSELSVFICDNCGCYKQTENLIINSTTTFRKFRDKNAVWREPYINYSLISVSVYDFLKNNGIDVSEFLPVYLMSGVKKKQPSAYQLYSSNVLTEAGFQDFEMKRIERCNKCKSIRMVYEEAVIDYEFNRINTEALSHMKDVNLTYEYYGGFRQLLISKKLYKLIISQVPDAGFIPVYLE